MNNISFEAEVISVQAKKTVSNDREFVIKLVTSESQALELQKFIAESSVKITVTDL